MPAVITIIVAMALAMSMVLMAMVVLVMSERPHHSLPRAPLAQAGRRTLVRALGRVPRRPRVLPAMRSASRMPDPALKAQIPAPAPTSVIADPAKAPALWIAQASLTLQTSPPAPADYAEPTPGPADSPAPQTPEELSFPEPAAPVAQAVLSTTGDLDVFADPAELIEWPAEVSDPMPFEDSPFTELEPAQCVQRTPSADEPATAPAIWAAQAFRGVLDTPAPLTPARTRLAEPTWPLRAQATPRAAGSAKAPGDSAPQGARPMPVRTAAVPHLPERTPVLPTPTAQPAATAPNAPKDHKAHASHKARKSHEAHRSRHANGSFFKGVGRLIAYILGRPVPAPAPEAFLRTSVIHPAQAPRVAQSPQPLPKAPKPPRPSALPAESDGGVDLSAPDPLLD